MGWPGSDELAQRLSGSGRLLRNWLLRGRVRCPEAYIHAPKPLAAFPPGSLAAPRLGPASVPIGPRSAEMGRGWRGSDEIAPPQRLAAATSAQTVRSSSRDVDAAAGGWRAVRRGRGRSEDSHGLPGAPSPL
eukprot:scaffold614_cov367-Prasinococcus_capsulatus_cf.AAC.24